MFVCAMNAAADFVAAHFNRQPADVYLYDLVLNSGFLGEDICAELIARAAEARNEMARRG